MVAKNIFFLNNKRYQKSKKEGKYQESIQSSTTSDPEHRMGK